MAIVKAYYRGAVRIVEADGVPCRVNSKPLPWRKYPKEREYRKREEIAAERVKAAERLIDCYAAALGISVEWAKARIEVQRLTNLDNPMRDETQDYDL